MSGGDRDEGRKARREPIPGASGYTPDVRDLPAGWESIYAVVRRIPRGRVTTYGAVAALLGRPRGARQVGYALAALRGTRHDVPWHRVLGARSRGRAAVSILDPMGAAVQGAKLRKEGVRFDERGMVDLGRHGWSGKRRRRPTGR
jgi:methylated-DNA-protein-cysteine methyltransferase-like protein